MQLEPVLCIFRLRHCEAEQVFLVGTFNDWSTTAAPMHRVEPDRWETSIKLPPGEHHYCYVAVAGPRADEPDGCSFHLELVNRVTPLCVPRSEPSFKMN